jgi:hypothetical protein
MREEYDVACIQNFRSLSSKMYENFCAGIPPAPPPQP